MSASDINETAQALDRRAALLDRIHEMLWKRLKPETDMTMIGGQPRFNKSFAALCFRVIGGQYEYIKGATGEPLVVRHDYEDAHGPYYVFTAYARYAPPFDNGWVEASGSCSSRAPFFGIADGEIRDLKDVNEDNVRRAALTDAFKKAVFAGLGMRHPTAEELVQHNIDKARAGKVEFQSGTQSTKAADTKDDAEMRAAIRAMCKECYSAGVLLPDGGKAATEEEVLKAATDNTRSGGTFDGWMRFDRISQKALPITYKNVKEFHAAAMSQTVEAKPKKG